MKNDQNKAGNAQFHCKRLWGISGALIPKSVDQAEWRKQVLQAYRECVSLRDRDRIFGVARSIVQK